MYSGIKNFSQKLGDFLYRRFLLAWQGRELANIRKQPNVQIHDSFYMGEQSGFSFSGPIGHLKIEQRVRCRKFCNFLIYPGAFCTIHENVFFNNYCSINCLGTIEIGENTIFGEAVKIYDHNHAFEKTSTVTVHRDQFKISKVIIGSNCWIGSNVTILMGVTIGDNVVVGANCLIHKSIPSNTVVKHKEELITESKL